MKTVTLKSSRFTDRFPAVCIRGGERNFFRPAPENRLAPFCLTNPTRPEHCRQFRHEFSIRPDGIDAFHSAAHIPPNQTVSGRMGCPILPGQSLAFRMESLIRLGKSGKSKTPGNPDKAISEKLPGVYSKFAKDKSFLLPSRFTSFTVVKLNQCKPQIIP